MLPLFYLPQIPEGQSFEVGGDLAHHAIVVTRLSIGAELTLSDGNGAFATGRIQSSTKKSFAFHVSERGTASQGKPLLTVVQALPKSDRTKEAIELMVEAGADRIIPWQASRSIAKWQGDSQEKWQQSATTAAQQSRRFFVPHVEQALKTSELLPILGKTIVLHESAPTQISAVVDKSWSTAPEIFIVIGPEGGISDEELAQFAPYSSIVKLGAPVLRSAHAAIAALAAVNSLLGRW
jgi:16S rRNA (uracil1498-N3)-methyltransferase